MSGKKWVQLLINIRWGAPSACYNHPDKRAVYVVHENYRPLDLREFYKVYHEDEFPRSQQREMRRKHPKQADEKFLCRSCWAEIYNNELRYDAETGQADFTSIGMENWKRRDYRLVEDVVMDFLVVRNN